MNLNRTFLFAHRISALLFSLVIVISGMSLATPEPAAACTTGGGVMLSIDEAVTNTHTTNCDFSGGGTRTGSGSYRVYECFYSGSSTWGDPRTNNATGTPKYTNSVLVESSAGPGNTNYPKWITAWKTRLSSANYTFGDRANLQSFYMRNKRADLLAAALQIYSNTPGNASSWRLRFTSPEARDDIIDGPHGPMYNPNSAPWFQSVNFMPGLDEGGSGSIYRIGLSNANPSTSINALVYPWGSTRKIPAGAYNGQVAANQMWADTYSAIGSRGGISGPQMMSSSPTNSMNALLWPSEQARRGTQYVDSRVEAARSWSWWGPSFPSRVWVETGVGTGTYAWTGYWTFVYNYNHGLYDTDQRYNVEVVFPNARPVYTDDQVVAGFKAVVRSQVSVQWNQSPTAIGGSSLRGSYYIPVGASGRDCPSDSFWILGIPLGSGGSCDALGIVSDSTAATKLGADCKLYWQYKREEPPKLTTADFNAIMGRVYSAVTFKPDTAAAIVGQPVTFRANGVRSRGLNFTNRLAADNSINIEVNLTQVGVTAYLGSQATPLVIIPRATQAGTEYTFQYTFQQTPAAKLQEPTCASAPNAATLKARCGIVFDANGEPTFELTFRTWWDGMYRYTGAGFAGSYRGLFTDAHSTMSASVKALTTPWVDGWNFNRNTFSNGGADTSGPWPLFGRTSPDSYGSPMYHNPDFVLQIPVLQVQPGQSE